MMERSRGALGRWVWRDYLLPEKGGIFAALGLMAVEGSMVGLLSYLLKPMFDRVFVGGDTGALWWIGTAILILFLVRGGAGIVNKVLLARALERAAARLQEALLSHIMTLDMGYHQSNPPGYLIERVQGDVLTAKTQGRAVILGLGRDVIALLSLFAVAIWIDPLWTLVAVVGVPLLVAPSVMAQRFTRDRTREAREVAGDMSTRLDEVFHGIGPIKLNALETYQLLRYQELLNRRVQAETQSVLGQSLIPGFIDVMTGIGFLGVLYFGGREIISGEKTIGEFMSFFTAMALMFEPLRRLGAVNGQWQAVSVSLARLRGILDEEPRIVSPASPRDPPQQVGDIELRDVHLAYGDLPVLRGASFVAKAGQTTALVGPSGAGKSTVFNVLTRLALPSGGKVLIGGTDVSALDLGDLRRLFSVVTQDALLFDETIRENILLGRVDVGRDTLEAAVRSAHLSDVVAGMPAGLETPAGPRGSGLSGGQRQRVAIARAILRDAPILLLDEATSALDAQSEAAVQAALETLSSGRTTLVIAHRLATVRGADRIVVMDRGRVVDQGRHDELLARGGIYADLYRLQFSEDAE